MKKYNKPELKIENYFMNSTIADSSVSDAMGGETPFSNKTENVGYNAWIGLFD